MGRGSPRKIEEETKMKWLMNWLRAWHPNSRKNALRRLWECLFLVLPLLLGFLR